MADITIPDEELAHLLSAQILSSLSEETRNGLIQHALKYLVVKPTDTYSLKVTPLQQSFESALTRLANKMADEVLAEDPQNAERIKEMFRKLLKDIPDFYTDSELQARMMKVILDRANQVRTENRYD